MIQSLHTNPPLVDTQSALSKQDQLAIENVESSLRRGIAIRKWWDQRRRADGFAEEFQLTRTFNEADIGYGFCDVVPDAGDLPIMGSVSEELFDQSKSHDLSRWQAELQEFVLRYFLRVGDFRQPDVYVDRHEAPASSMLRGFSWCPERKNKRGGFGYSQLYFKRRSTGEVGKFPEEDRFAIVDVRELGDQYEWIVLRVKIFDFVITLSPPGRVNPISADGVHIGIPLCEETLVVLSRDFVSNEDRPCPGIAGRYGFGYALVDQSSENSLLAYGPGHFQAGFQLFTFDVHRTGEIRSRRVFAVNRPQRILNVPLDPLNAACRMADFVSFGLTSSALKLGKQICAAMPRGITIDPILPSISLANTLTGDSLSRQFCISKEQLEVIFLQQHYKQNYELMVGALRTWRQVQDWLDTPALPPSVVQGVTV